MLAGGAYPAMLALGMLKAAPANAFNLQGSGKGKKIIILGAGLAGMSTAYELEKLGYECVLIEARDRVGGRCFSVKQGTTNQEINQPLQTADFDAGLYFNAGPSRIAHHHQITLQYCKELGVPLETYNNVNEAAYYFAEGKGPLSNKKIRIKEIQNDVRGYTSELLAKAMDKSQLDAALTKEDTQKIIEFLRAEGGLDIDKLYKASSRRGHTKEPAEANQAGVIADAYKLQDIIASGLLDPDFYNVTYYTYELQMTMFQAVGGMDKIATALHAKLKSPIQFNAEVTDIKNTNTGVTISYNTKQGAQQIQGDLCICTIPLPVLSNINHNFSSDVSRAIDYIQYINTCKIGLQFKRRFWEEDEGVYGGITHTNNELTQIFYPNNDYLGKKGVLIGCYNFNDKAKRTGALNFKEREQFALQKGSLIHPQYTKEIEQSFSIAWHNTKYSQGGWAMYSDAERKSVYQALLKPDGNVYFAGEHLTHWNAWMAGAFLSARSVVANIHARVNEQKLAYQSPT